MQAGYQDQTSQRNISIVEGTMVEILDLDLPLLVRNPDFGPHLLEFDIRTFGLGPDWLVQVVDPAGQPAPDMINPGQTLPLMLQIAPTVRSPAQDELPVYDAGDETRIEVDVVLDGTIVGGVAYILALPDDYDLFLPIVSHPD
jgi:hypothetical protein